MNENTDTRDAIRIERTLEASIETVWKLWTEPEHFKHWYGPAGFSVPVADFDLRPGGVRLVCMQMPDEHGGGTMCTTGKHLEISPTTRLVYTESMADAEGNVVEMEGHPAVTEITVVLEDLGGSTRMNLTHAGLPADSPGASGWNQAFDKLADYIERL